MSARGGLQTFLTLNVNRQGNLTAPGILQIANAMKQLAAASKGVQGPRGFRACRRGRGVAERPGSLAVPCRNPRRWYP